MAANLLRTRDGHHARVGFVELFFDLVFVFAVTQISHSLLHHLTWLGALQAAMMAAAVWWAWIYTSWVTNWLDPERIPVRIALFVLMGLGLLMSTSLPEAFGERGLLFAIAFVATSVFRSGFMLWASRKDAVLPRNFQRILSWQLLSGAFWIAGGLMESEMRIALWLAALAIDYAGPAAGYRVPGLGVANTADWTVEGGHMAERVGLFVIICLGESLLITGATFAATPWTTEVILAAAVAFVGALAMWWIYFSAAHDAASEVISHATDTGALARAAYTYCPVLIVAGIIVTAVGDELSLVHPSGHVATATAAVLIGGPLLFMIGGLLAKVAVFGRWSVPRTVGCIAIAALWLAVPLTTPLGLAALTTGVLIAVAAWETVRLRSQ
ncbi:MAG TPA: low temperature requirement protein A [Brevundimonas sp.]|jgi:low temperature requirement protein LtrA